jgi:hypothetical protein
MSSMVLLAQQERKVKSNAEMSFTSLSHDYGSIVYGADGTYKFQFTNKAEKQIVITNVKSSCGCTIPSWPKEPIQPGKTGSITVKYNTKLPGSFNKTVQVFSTAKNSPVKLSIRGKVNAKPSDVKNSANSTTLLNGTKVKKGMGKTATSTEQGSKEVMTASQRNAIGGSGNLSRYKEAKRKAYQKAQAQKTIKKQ